MPEFESLLHGRSSVTIDQAHRLHELVADWQLLSDLSFADLILWVPIRKDVKLWPTGHVAVAHIRPTTTATVFADDVIGREVSWGSNPSLDEALSSGEIGRDAPPEKLGEIMVKEETIPVLFDGQIIAVISRHRNADLMRSPSSLELNYREIANNLYQMVSQGSFPYAAAGSIFEPLPRVGDGLIRLDINGVISYASPNARSAFSRMGWKNEIENNKLGDIAEEVIKNSPDAHEEAIRTRLNGKVLRRVEIDNKGATIDLLVLPLLQSIDRVGAIVLLQNVTELRRRERELVTKDATIREIHHRVKNNLQTVSALLRLQARRIEDPGAASALNEAVRRIASIALVHETLSSSSENTVAFDEVLTSLITHALELSPRTGELKIERIGQLGSLDSRLATPLSLVVTELMHNALEHGLAEEGTNLLIDLQRYSNECVVKISDDGVGLPDGFDISTSSNLGLQIVRTLTENELKGKLTLISSDSGTVATLRFPL
ncbi:MAG: histidine kinase [Actinobacteria bacterium]|uniref:histidine kinase n=1 Tax=freshwater metagenome TaxID=449393 RepID=A0A6J7AY64_9ZZZZ|nr:histidine kinase [Actinomycetota bacterium]MSY35283.1 histidine kinase [Actinomycetota bacterium]MTA71848.1 histidine kinase [Actinomycetota bacterium]MUH48396.1 histidine kinase [Actinomycetota bacterium]